MKFNLVVVVGRVDRLSSCAGNEMSFQEGTKHSFLSFRLFGPQEGRTRAGAGGPGYSNSFCLLQKLCYCNLRYKGDSDMISHGKWRETNQQPSRVRSGHQISCSLLSLHFLGDILSGRLVRVDAGWVGSLRRIAVGTALFWTSLPFLHPLSLSVNRTPIFGAPPPL